ncbi:hypothetical protein AXG93_1881s1130 [Marchantia polymorpha subsp. ruderalis]|uniref:J domain-containing protein n=1 Tax=Marchantia polymorpha subsp. ruderalis TaxID=1480154 RepID=A0A176W5M5_MARPO|nr:hypothetical protein AXG93_1881s1130 [Marchantia polymorpha subsp. ruderalis]
MAAIRICSQRWAPAISSLRCAALAAGTGSRHGAPGRACWRSVFVGGGALSRSRGQSIWKCPPDGFRCAGARRALRVSAAAAQWKEDESPYETLGEIGLRPAVFNLRLQFCYGVREARVLCPRLVGRQSVEPLLLSMETCSHPGLQGVSRDVEDDEIKAAYRRMAKQFHPDVYDNSKELLEEGETAESKFIRIQAAYELLMDRDQRRQYDLDHRINPMQASRAWMDWVMKKKKAFEQRGDMAASVWAEQQQREMSLKARRLARHKFQGLTRNEGSVRDAKDRRSLARLSLDQEGRERHVMDSQRVFYRLFVQGQRRMGSDRNASEVSVLLVKVKLAVGKWNLQVDPEEERRILAKERQASLKNFETTVNRHTLVLKKRELNRRKADEAAKAKLVQQLLAAEGLELDDERF